MKRAYACFAILVMAAALPQSSHAQFFKNLVNAATQSATNHAANKAVPGKPDSNAAKSGYDSARMAQLMAGLNRPKPSISPADSAAAIKSFMTGTGGSGIQYRYHVTYDFKRNQKDSTISDTMSMAFTESRNAHVEFGMLGMKMVTIGHGNTPRYSIFLYPDSKTYNLNIVDTAAINAAGGQTYKVTKIGNETVAGYNCIHSKLTIITGIGRTSEVTEDMWTSTAVPGYAQLEKAMTVQNVTPKMLQAMDQAGCGGFFVKMQVLSTSMSMVMLLIDAEHKTLPASLFEIPAGYTQANNTNMMANMLRKK